jgi:hypothetical protein
MRELTERKKLHSTNREHSMLANGKCAINAYHKTAQGADCH